MIQSWFHMLCFLKDLCSSDEDESDDNDDDIQAKKKQLKTCTVKSGVEWYVKRVILLTHNQAQNIWSVPVKMNLFYSWIKQILETHMI